MPRYFFEVERRDIVFDDNVGADYPSDDAALRGGQRLAEELGRDAPEHVGDTLKILNDGKEVLGRMLIVPPKELLQ